MSELSTEDHVTSVFIAALFFGIYLATLFDCLRWLIFADEGWRLRKGIHWTSLIVASLLCNFSGANIALTLRGLRTEVQQVPPPAPPPSTSNLTPTPDWVSIFDCTTSNLSALLADIVLIHRCWIVYEKVSSVILFPIFCWLGGLVCTILQAYWQIIRKEGLLTAWQPIDMQIGPGTILTAFWACTIIINAYATFAITRRLWLFSKEDDEEITPYQSVRFVSQVITESGLLYLAVTTTHLVVWFTPSVYAISVISNINLPVIGIAYNLIIVRTHRRKADEDRAYRSYRREPSIEFAPPPMKVVLQNHFSMANNASSSETVTVTDTTGSTSSTETAVVPDIPQDDRLCPRLSC